jgi:hypothetical protein
VVNPAAAKGSNVHPMVFHDRICFAQVGNVILGIVFPDGRDISLVLQGRYGFIEVLIEFLPEDFFEFLTVITGVGFEIFLLR